MIRSSLTFRALKNGLSTSKLDIQRCISMTHPVRRLNPSQLNRATLIGTVVHEQPMTLGWRHIVVRTICPGTMRESTHSVRVRTGVSLEPGYRIWIDGQLNSRKFATDTGLKQDNYWINASNFRLLDCDPIIVRDDIDILADDDKNENVSSKSNASTTTADENAIEMMARVEASVHPNEHHTVFTLVQYHRYGIDAQEPTVKHFFSVFVHSTELQIYVQQNLQHGDRVLIKGSMSNRRKTSEEGKRCHSGSIAATSVHKVAELNKESYQSPKSDFIK